MQAKTRWPKIGLFLMTLPLLSAIPLTAEALEVRFCVPTCAADPSTPRIRKGRGRHRRRRRHHDESHDSEFHLQGIHYLRDGDLPAIRERFRRSPSTLRP